MKYDDLVGLFGSQGWFELATLVQAASEERHSLQVQLYRWCRSGKLLSLRRGMYALPEHHRKHQLAPTALANSLYAPSYLSTYWALSYYGMIPELVPQYSSITRRKPAQFENAFGLFVYRNIKASAFFGYRTIEISGVRVQVAEPEKALLDLWHLESGVWDRPRMEAMRFQSLDQVDQERLETYANRFRSARLRAAVRVWKELSDAEDEGVEL